MSSTIQTTGRKQFTKFKTIISVLVFSFSLFGKRGNAYLLRKFRNCGGRIGILLRYIFLKNSALYLGDNVLIATNVYLFNVQNLKIGKNVSVHPMCYIDAIGSIEIGNEVSIAHNCSILSVNHQWDNLNIPIKYNTIIKKPVVIEDDVWLGCGVRVLSGVKIESRVCIAAGAVVTRDIPNNTLAGGVPAKIIKKI